VTWGIVDSSSSSFWPGFICVETAVRSTSFLFLFLLEQYSPQYLSGYLSGNIPLRLIRQTRIDRASRQSIEWVYVRASWSPVTPWQLILAHMTCWKASADGDLNRMIQFTVAMGICMLKSTSAAAPPVGRFFKSGLGKILQTTSVFPISFLPWSNSPTGQREFVSRHENQITTFLWKIGQGNKKQPYRTKFPIFLRLTKISRAQTNVNSIDLFSLKKRWWQMTFFLGHRSSCRVL